jgi:tetratricopeptide (TPR) repeat protein
MKFLYLSVRNFFIYLKDFKELFLEKLIRIVIYQGAILLPLFFVPLSSQFLNYSKVILFYLLVFLGMLLWILKIYLSKRINFYWQFLDVPLIIMLFIYFLASLFSHDRYQSFIGTNLNVSCSFVTFLSLLIFYFLVSHFINQIREIKIIFGCLLFSISILFVNNLLNIFAINFSPVFLGNSLNNFYFLLLLFLILSSTLSLLGSKKIRIIFLIFSLFALLTLYLIDNQQVLLLLIFSIFFFILLSSFRSQFFSNKFVVTLTLFLFLTVLVLVIPISNFTGLMSTSELSLPNYFGWKITKASLAENFLLGSGPQNFVYSFYKYKPLEFNLTNFWQLSFEKNSNFWLEILSSLGTLGILLAIIIVIKYFYRLLLFLRKFEIVEGFALEKFILTVIVSIIIIDFIILGFFWNFNFILVYLLFLFLALGVSLIQPEKLGNIFINKTIINLLVYFFLILILCLGYFGIKIILSDIYTTQALAKNYVISEDFNWGEKKFKMAISNNPLRPDYVLNFFNFQINKLYFLQKNNQSEELDAALKEIINSSDSISKIESKRVDYNLSLQQAYTTLKSLGLANFENQKIINERLLNLDPNNPELYIDRTLINFDNYLQIKNGEIEVSDPASQMSTLLKEIKTDIGKSISLKNNYVLGYYNYGLYYQEIGEETAALENIAKAFALDPSQKLIALSLKTLYLNQDNTDKAIEVLTQYLNSNPQDTEMLLELALIYKNNNPDKAKEELNKILAIEPENVKAKELLNQIK